MKKAAADVGLHPYCIVPAALAPAGNGIAFQPIQAVRAGDLSAWCTVHERPPEPAPQNLRDHDRVVRTAFTDTVTPVPLRFGQWFGTEQAVQQQLAERHPEWQRALERLSGAVEMGVRLARAREACVSGAPPPAPPADEGPALGSVSRGREPPGSGRAYLERLRAEFLAGGEVPAAHEDLLAVLAGAVSKWVLESRLEPNPEESAHLRVAHLVRRAQLHAYGEALAELRRRFPDLSVQVTGPWPPYTFVG